MSVHEASDHGHSGLLSDATLAELQLRHQPFTTELSEKATSQNEDGDFLAAPFSDAITEEQLADIKQALITGDDLLLILGEKGAGKTTLLQQLDANSGLRIQCFSVTGSKRFSTLNLFAGMLDAFQIKAPTKLKDILDELIPCLQSMVARNTLSAIVLDDAHEVSRAELTQLLSGMLYMNSQDETLMRVALAAPSEFEDLIPDMLPEGADLPYSSLTIEGYSPQRAAAYLDYRLSLAGFDREFPFTERDMASLVDHSGGRPAELHVLTADILNEKYGQLGDSMPRELLSDEGPGFLQSRMGKLALGAVATFLILGGILMFLPEGEQQDLAPLPERVVVTQNDEPIDPEVPELKLIEPEQAPTADEAEPTATGSDSGAADIETAQAETAQADDESSAGNQTAEEAADAQAPAQQNASSASSNANQAGSSQTERNQPSDDQTAGQDTQADGQSATDQATGSQAENETGNDQSVAEQASENQQPDSAANDDEPSPDPSSQPASTSTTTGIDAELADLLESPSWILVQDESRFTIQMSASRDLASVQNFLRRNPLPRPNSIFSFERSGDVWFALVHGVFPTLSEAQTAVEQMPAGAQRDQPWIRSISRVKEILREE